MVRCVRLRHLECLFQVLVDITKGDFRENINPLFRVPLDTDVQDDLRGAMTRPEFNVDMLLTVIKKYAMFSLTGEAQGQPSHEAKYTLGPISVDGIDLEDQVV